MILLPRLIEPLGLDLVQRKSHIITVGGTFIVPKVHIPRIYALGYELRDVEALAYELPEKIGVEVILGLKFFKKFTQLNLNFKEYYVEILR
jgi:hypothetical protein